ncbi:MAG: hypothetical protein IT579_02380 [Verrucomicrobia subdivision 3 bacterium]|nr:hypothetical protein [Limisphaerales bacterium]
MATELSPPWHGQLGRALVIIGFFILSLPANGAAFDAAPFGLALPGGKGVLWEDPREIHRVVVHFASAPPLDTVRLEYWGSRWPEQRLPKDREPGGGDIGWMELGNWYQYDWRIADTGAVAHSNAVEFTFHPVNAKEFPKLNDYPAAFRYTLKLRVASDGALPAIDHIEAFTDSVVEPRAVRLVWKETHGADTAEFEAFNGRIEGFVRLSTENVRAILSATTNPDPNTFDRTLVTVRFGKEVFTFKVDDLATGPLFLPHLGVAVLSDIDNRDYPAVAAEVKARGAKTLYDRVAELPEQTWHAAWEGVPRKKSDIYFPLGLEGGRERFRLEPSGSTSFRYNELFLKNRPGQDTPRLDLENRWVSFTFGLPAKPAFRTLAEASLPVVQTRWEVDGVRVEQTAFASALNRAQAEGPLPAGDAFTVFLARFSFTNPTAEPRTATLPLSYKTGDEIILLRADAEGRLWNGEKLRGQYVADATPVADQDQLKWSWILAPGESRQVVLKIPYVILTETAERAALDKLAFDRELAAVSSYWRRRLDQSAKLITPEPMLNEFYRSHAMHLLVNCEREPGSDRRFARVGSFSYGAYGNESCMMVVDLDRRGYHQEAQDCLDAWLHYQGTVALPGSFASKAGVLYGAGGYESGGYNQHHGWILWMLAEHYRFTRDQAWLRRSAPGIVQGCDWIIRETARTKDRHELERGLLPAGSLEDIGDWWTWLSTSCYTWRGLDSAAWALEQIQHPEAKRIRAAAAAYHTALLANFRKASERSPVVRLRDGTAVPHIPSMVHRRGRYFGWICETLEGSLHLLITGALPPHSPEAEWILKDYEDNRYLANQYGYVLDNFERDWFSRGGMSMQACLLLDVEPYLYRDDVKQALRALFNGQAVSYFPDVRMNTEHALPDIADWRGDHFKSSDEANTAGWLRYLFVREEGDTLLLGQAVPREWLRAGQKCGLERTVTYFGKTSVAYSGGENEITAALAGPTRNPPKQIRLRFREPNGRPLQSVIVNGKPWPKFKGEWVDLPGNLGSATVVARFRGL